METFIAIVQVVATCIQGVVSLFIFLTLVVYYFQLRTSQKSSESQNLITIINFLQDETTRSARDRVIRQMQNTDMANWSDEDKRAAGKVCSTYDVAAILLRNGYVPLNPIIDNWGPSISICYKTLRPYIAEMQRPKNAGTRYWNDFSWLNQQVQLANTHKA
jgi:hypothetical protein